MIDSLMPSSDTSASAKRPLIESEVPRCKKRKKKHHWSKKSKKCSVLKVNKCKNGKKVLTKPEAPFNSTQFIMDEHDCLKESDLSTVPLPRKRRDSSTSVVLDDAPVDNLDNIEEALEHDNFMSEQFWSTYNDFDGERFNGQSKAQLIQEYIALEEKLNNLERDLVLARTRDNVKRMTRAPSPGCEEVPPPGEVPVDAETAAKIEVFRNEIDKLNCENEGLRNDNKTVDLNSIVNCRRCALRGSSSNSSDDEDGSSSTTSGSYDSDDSSKATATKTRKLLLSSLSPPNTAEGFDSKATSIGIHLGIESRKVSTSTVDFVSDSGIASASSGDDLRLEDREEERIVMKYSKSPLYSAIE